MQRPNAIAPPDWINLWLHNDYWVFDTEARAWAAAAEHASRRLYAPTRLPQNESQKDF